MRRMNTRQALLITILPSLLAGLWACAPSNRQAPTQTSIPSTPTPTSTPTPIPPTPTPTPLTCLAEPGRVKKESIDTVKPAQEFIIFLPPCYGEMDTTRYPVLYLLHGLTYNDDQWVRIGATDTASRLIISGETPPFIIVLPDDRYWNQPAGEGFGDRVINLVIPYVDANYRTLNDRNYRALGGLSLGGGWAIHLGFRHPELFGALGLHSPAVFKEDAPFLENMIQAIPADGRPVLWFDLGDRDSELTDGRALEAILARNDYIHEFHLYSGDHTENYWSLHMEEYLRWYTGNWNMQAVDP